MRLTWADVGQDASTLTTAKSEGKRVVIIPITPKTRAIVKQIGRKDVGAVLTRSGGKPWTGWGLQTAMRRAKTDRRIKGLRFHDLRGTAATHFASHLPLTDVARITGWTPQRVDATAGGRHRRPLRHRRSGCGGDAEAVREEQIGGRFVKGSREL